MNDRVVEPLNKYADSTWLYWQKCERLAAEIRERETRVEVKEA